MVITNGYYEWLLQMDIMDGYYGWLLQMDIMDGYYGWLLWMVMIHLKLIYFKINKIISNQNLSLHKGQYYC